LEQFATEIEPIRDTWRWIDLRILAIDESGLGWLCDSARALLTTSKPHLITGLPEVEGLLARQNILPIEKFRELLETVGSSEIPLDQDVVHVRQGGSGQFQPIPGYNPRWFDRPVSASQFGVDWKTFALQTWGSLTLSNERYRRLSLLDARLQEQEPPWDGLPDLRTGFLGMNANDAIRQDAARVDILAPLFVKLGPRSSVRGRRCTVEVELERTMKPEDVAVAIFGLENGKVRHRLLVRFSPAKGRLKKGVLLPKRFDAIRCVLTYRGMSAEARDLYQDIAKAPGSRWAAFRGIVGDPVELEMAITGKTGDPLEHAVATLLHLMGLAVAHYGRNTFPRGGDMADIVAFDELGGTLLLVECTARAVDPTSEIAKLATRARELQNQVPNTVVLPAFVTLQKRAELIEPALDIAIRERVAIITSDDLKSLITSATQTPSGSRAAQLVSTFVPQKSAF